MLKRLWRQQQPPIWRTLLQTKALALNIHFIAHTMPIGMCKISVKLRHFMLISKSPISYFFLLTLYLKRMPDCFIIIYTPISGRAAF